jgi:hypothetical protein
MTEATPSIVTETTPTTVPPKVAHGAIKKAPAAKPAGAGPKGDVNKLPSQAAPAPKPAPAPKAVTYGRYQPDDVITVLVDNPKKGDSKKRFEIYGPKGSKLTVADYIAKVGHIGIGDLRWDTDPRRKFISVTRGGSPVA